MMDVFEHDGKQISVHWNDGARCWVVSIPDGIYWKNIYSFGHSQTSASERLQRAKEAVDRHVATGSAYRDR